ncbi:MAG: replicative DNA helicase [Oscillospiraceae bacterium]|nr:replicative DNA helicase [Oscillospiraceae bacterium]
MEELLGRQAPHNTQAEQAILGSMLIDPRCIPDVVDKVSAADFFITANRDIFETVYTMFAYGQTIDPITVLDQMKVRGVYRENESEKYIRDLMQSTPTAANVLEYCAIVRDKALLRGLCDVASEINDMVYDGTGEAGTVLEAAERKIYALRQGRNTGGLMPVAQVVNNAYAQIQEAAESQDAIPGLSTGLPDIDKRILGLNSGELIFIAARPGMGKTSIALNIALSVAKNTDKAVAIFSLEMAREQIVTRMLAYEGLVNGKKLLTGNLTEEDWRRIGAAATTISRTNMYVDDNPILSVADMNAACRRIENLGLVVIDYLQLMTSAGGKQKYASESRTQVVSDISRMLKIMAKELNIPVVCLSQLSRASESRQDKRPQLSDLRESGSIEQDADVVIGLYRDGYYNQESETPNLAEAIILKNRKGEVGTVNLSWLPEYTAFAQYEGRYDDEY